MIRNIRPGVFETNSSSTHSICISGDSNCVLDTLYMENETVDIFSGEFGWEVEQYNDAPTKAAYCLTYIKSHDNNENEEKMLRKVIQEVTGAKTINFVPDGKDSFYKWGYIDHQSEDVCGEAFESEEKLKAFIFNPHSYLITDNDNH